jgi:putative transcriptional regulator
MDEQDEDSLIGRLVVATQDLVDPNFAHAVVLLLDHDEDGAFGVILNRPSEAPVAEALPPWSDLVAEPPVVYVGGPVQPQAVIALGRLPLPAPAEVAGMDVPVVTAGVGIVDLAADPTSARRGFSAVRLFAGYAGWGPGQLEVEIASGSWFIVETDPADVFTAAPEGLWRVVLARQGGLFTTVVEDPSRN